MRLGVKSGAYLQAWEQRSLSTVTWGGLNSRAWTAEGGRSAASSYNADAYVFALHTARTHDAYEALDTDQWSFWVLPVSVVADTGHKSLRLARDRALVGESVAYRELAAAVRSLPCG